MNGHDASDVPLGMQPFQEAAHGAGFDYCAGSPHLKHRALYDRLSGLVLEEAKVVHDGQLPLTALEVGAGHGGFTEPALASGLSVTATEMSRPSVDRLARRFATNPNFRAVFDADGSLEVLGDDSFSLVLCASVLHHIVDYVDFLGTTLDEHLNRGGSLVTVQDPVLYRTMSRLDLALTRAAYASWRVTRGRYLQGVQTQLRRLVSGLDERNPLDMSEYHVVRCGVDADAIVDALSPRFDTVMVWRYWSTQSAMGQRLGAALGRENTFAVVARGFRG